MDLFEQVTKLMNSIEDLVHELERVAENRRRDVNVLHKLIDSQQAAYQSQLLDVQHELAAAYDQQMYREGRLYEENRLLREKVAKELNAHADTLIRNDAARQQLKLKLKAFADRMRYVRVGHCPDRSAAYLALERELESAWRNA